MAYGRLNTPRNFSTAWRIEKAERIMKNIRVYILLMLLAVIFLPLTAAAQSKEQREKIDRMATQIEDLKTELVLLQRQTQTMQDTFNKTMGELNTLIVQMSDNISTIRRATESVSTRGGDVVSQVNSMGERLTATNERMERLSEQFAQLRKFIEDFQKGPVMRDITPATPTNSSPPPTAITFVAITTWRCLSSTSMWRPIPVPRWLTTLNTGSARSCSRRRNCRKPRPRSRRSE